MNSLYVWLFASMSVSVQGHTASANGWSMTIADYVTAEEGGAAVLPCSFTHPDTNLTLTGSVIWMKHSKGVIFNCTYPGTGHSKGELCENVIQQDGGNRFRFVGNLSNNDASILVDGLGQEDNGSHRCRVELNLDRFGTRKGTKLEVTASQEEVSVVSGTEGESVTLPCIFKTKRNYPLTAVAWMRKEPYQHIITFTAQSQGNWTTGNGGNQYELIGSPEEGNASTRINQLSVRDNHTFLCLVEYSSKPDSQYLIQKETRLLVMPVRRIESINKNQLVIPLLSVLLIFFILIIVLIIFRKKGGYSQKIEQTTSLKRNDPGLSSIPRTDEAQQPPAPDQDGSSFYVEIDNNRTAQPDPCTYANIVFDSNKKAQDGKILSVTDSEENVTYAAIVNTC
ncbi:uncharacterized protein LOC125449501 isoform X2 [Stegostoma tigrinum]|uniref:uncharacterized protein LOC125449501 isoform X2 n=1 Tax=Stegostoma tigrinum TaxID=3053191 RepID=UPI00202AE424|nr:uncharacterized protein LOC125449501 isoform X2 [Stegostoma tigrinum]XP_048381290.1 uncharacterized protein LOC125449501 isoform X2 [Stegostoma tigrinum]